MFLDKKIKDDFELGYLNEGGNSLNGSDNNKGGSQVAKGSARGSQQTTDSVKFGFKRQKSFNQTSLKTKEL